MLWYCFRGKLKREEIEGKSMELFGQDDTAKDATEEENETGEEDTCLPSKLKTPHGLLVTDGWKTYCR